MGYSLTATVQESKARAKVIVNLAKHELVLAIQQKIQRKLPAYSEEWDLLEEAMYRLAKDK